MSDSFFEDNRAGDGELWGTALVDGDGSTNTLLHGFSLPNSLAAGDNLGLQKPEAVFRKRIDQVDGVDHSFSSNTLLRLLACTGLKRCRIASPRTAEWAMTSCGGQLSTGTAGEAVGGFRRLEDIRCVTTICWGQL